MKTKWEASRYNGFNMQTKVGYLSVSYEKGGYEYRVTFSAQSHSRSAVKSDEAAKKAAILSYKLALANAWEEIRDSDETPESFLSDYHAKKEKRKSDQGKAEEDDAVQ